MLILDSIYGYITTLFSKRYRHILKPHYAFSDFPAWAKDVDLFFNLTRPAIEQHLSSELLVLRKVKEFLKSLLLLFCALGANVVLWFVIPMLSISIPDPWPFYLYLAPWCLALYDIGDTLWPYLRLTSRETYGKGKWMTAKQLRKLGYLYLRGEIPDGYSFFAPFNAIYDVFLPLKVLFTSRLFCGKPGTGKSATFHSQHLKDAARHGNAIAVDVKGELYKLTAHYFKDRYRLDFRDPSFSDRFNLIAACRGNDTLTAQVANYIIVGGSKDGRGDSNNKFFYDGAAALLTAVILHLAEGKDPEYPNATMSDVYSILAGGKDGPALAVEEHNKRLNAKLLSSYSVRARQTWSAFTASADPKTMGNILATLYTAIEGFRESAINKVFQSPTPLEQARGCREIDWNFLRGDTHTCLYIVMTAEQSSRLSAIVSTLFGIAMSRLLSEVNDPTINSLKPCYLQIDEGGNFRISGLAEFVAVCRGSNVCVDLSVQSLEQLTVAYGADYSKQIIEVFGSKIIFPGAEGHTAQYFSEMLGYETTRERKVVDLPGTAFDQNEDREVSRFLVQREDFRTMAHMKEAIAIITTLLPIRIGFPQFTAEVDPRRSNPTKFFEDVEEIEPPPAPLPAPASRESNGGPHWDEGGRSPVPVEVVSPEHSFAQVASASAGTGAVAVAATPFRPKPQSSSTVSGPPPGPPASEAGSPTQLFGGIGLDEPGYVPTEEDQAMWEEQSIATALENASFGASIANPVTTRSSSTDQPSFRTHNQNEVILMVEADDRLDGPAPLQRPQW